MMPWPAMGTPSVSLGCSPVPWTKQCPAFKPSICISSREIRDVGTLYAGGFEECQLRDVQA